MQYRYSKGYSREVLAGLAGISKTFLYEIETGRKGFSVETLYALADALEIEVVDIIISKEKTDSQKNYFLSSEINPHEIDHLIQFLSLLKMKAIHEKNI